MHVDKRYYNKDKLFSYRAYMMFSISERGLGKTTCAKMWCVDDFKKTGHRFAWVRRYNTELTGDKKLKIEGCVKDFFKKIKKWYPDDTFEIKGNHAYINGKDAGVFLALSTSQNMKSVDFPDINKIIFDEFIIKVNKALTYLSDEVELFLDLMSTIFRPMENNEEEGTRRDRVWLMANAITFANPYFYFFGIKPFPITQQFSQDRKRGIVVEQCKNEVYREAVRKTQFGKLIKGTKYEKYAINNEFLLDNNDFIGKKSPDAELQFNVKYDGQVWGIYADAYNVYVSFKTDPNRPCMTFTNKDHSLNTLLLKNIRNTRFEMLIKNYQLGFVKCENILIKNKFVEFMRLFVSK